MRPAPLEARRGGRGRGRPRSRRRPLSALPPSRPAAKRLALLLAATAALLLPGLGAAPFQRAEIYFADGARAMVERGDWLVPYYRGEPFFDKPALTYWLTALSFRLSGFTAAAARLPAALAALGAVAATVWLGASLFGRRTALAGGLVLATTAAFVSFGRVAMSDMLLTLWSTLAVALAHAALGPAPRPWMLPALGAVLGLGFLTKGPIAVLLPGLGIGLLLRRRWPVQVKAASLAWAALLFGVIGFGWFAAVALRLGAGPLEYFFLRENLERFAGETYDSGRAPWYYLGAYLALGLPWSPFLPFAGLRAWQERDSGGRFLLGWMGLMAIPLSLARGKIDYYLLPFLPAASLVIAAHFDRVWTGRERLWGRVVLAAVAAALAAAAWVPLPVAAEWLPGPGVRLACALGLTAAALMALAAAVTAAPPRVLAAIAVASATVYLLVGAAYLPAFRARQPSRAIVDDVGRELRYRPEASVVLCEDPLRVQRDLLFFMRVSVEERCDLWNPASSRRPYLFVLSARESASLEKVPNLRVVSEHVYLPASALTFQGLVGGPRPQRLVLAANYETSDPVAETKRKKERKRALRVEGESR